MHRILDWNSDRVLFRKFAENSDLLAWITIASGACVYMASAWSFFTGQPPEDVLGFGWLLMLHPDDREPVKEAFVKSSSDGILFSTTYRLSTANGDYRCCRAVGTPCFDQDRKFSGYIGVTSPITEEVTKPDQRGNNGRKILSQREQQVLSLVAEGVEPAGIAERLQIGLRTVGAHVHNAQVKLNARNRLHACIIALRIGEIDFPVADAPSFPDE